MWACHRTNDGRRVERAMPPSCCALVAGKPGFGGRSGGGRWGEGNRRDLNTGMSSGAVVGLPRLGFSGISLPDLSPSVTDQARGSTATADELGPWRSLGRPGYTWGGPVATGPAVLPGCVSAAGAQPHPPAVPRQWGANGTTLQRPACHPAIGCCLERLRPEAEYAFAQTSASIDWY